MNLTEYIIKELDAFIQNEKEQGRKMTQSKLSIIIMNDNNFYDRLKEGKVQIKNAQKALDFCKGKTTGDKE
jgi:hypothetical protein